MEFVCTKKDMQIFINNNDYNVDDYDEMEYYDEYAEKFYNKRKADISANQYSTTLSQDGKEKEKQGMKTLNVYDIVLVYAGDKKPIVKREIGVGMSEEQGKINSGIYKHIQEGWNEAYITVKATAIAQVSAPDDPMQVIQAPAAKS